MKLESYLAGKWAAGSGDGEKLWNPVTGEELATASSAGLDLAAALKFARDEGNAALQKLTYKERAEMLGKIAERLTAKRAEYFDISRQNQGTTEGDASFDVDGATYTLKQYAKWGSQLEGKLIKDGAAIPLSKTGAFQGQHFLKPLTGVAVFINAFNFPAWGLWEKAAGALLAGVPVFVKPATATAWLTQRMVKDVIEANILPVGAMSILCGSAGDLLEHVREDDVVAFTGSAGTAARIKTHPNVVARSVRVNVEADSLNSAILGPDSPGTVPFDLMVKEVAREMTVKAGQKCTAIRRVLVPRAQAKALGEAIAARLQGTKVGNPANAEVKCGPVVNKTQQKDVLEGLAKLRKETSVLAGGSADFKAIDADASKAAFVEPTLLFCEKPMQAKAVHDVEVFGPVATVLPYDSTAEAIELAKRGCGSLVASIFSDDDAFKSEVTLGIASMHGRIMVVDSSVNTQHTGHGNVMPNCLHGGPGRAGGGEELGGLRAMLLYHRRFVVQGPPSLIESIAKDAIDVAKLTS
ncbi:MAG TPA: 3,4-dehydroadipyl-CoA semialdehyde dehydrogenase [Terriglobales bacterium]|nr:3,4-dehydroadipyl-CoA semialdehyde dehydrogenase [Terriglobales bacterium]